MNRYVLTGVLTDMRAGRGVLVLTDNLQAARTFHRDAAAEREPGEGVSFTHGHEKMWRGDGSWLRFRSWRSSLRGLTADVVVVDVDPYLITDWKEIEAVVATGGEIVHCR